MQGAFQREKVAQLFQDDTFLSTYQEYSLKYMTLPRQLFGELALHGVGSTPHRVLDIGCGDGKLIEYLAKRCPNTEFVGIDASKQLITAAESRCREIHAKFYQRPAEDLGTGFAPFDLIVSYASLRLWRNPEKVFEHANSLLADGGVFFLSDLCGGTSIENDVVMSLPSQFRPLLETQLTAAYGLDELNAIVDAAAIKDARLVRGGLAGFPRMSEEALAITRDNPRVFEILMELNSKGGGLPHPAASELIVYLQFRR